MKFSVFYDFDLPEGESVRHYTPKNRHLWAMTERDDRESEYSYLGGSWEKGKHRKWVALLTKEQFEEWLSSSYLRFEDVETMGSIGAPGFGFSHAPAFAFTMDCYDAIGSAYVTPIPEPVRMPRHDGRDSDWERIRRALKAAWE